MSYIQVLSIHRYRTGLYQRYLSGGRVPCHTMHFVVVDLQNFAITMMSVWAKIFWPFACLLIS